MRKKEKENNYSLCFDFFQFESGVGVILRHFSPVTSVINRPEFYSLAKWQIKLRRD